MMKKLLKKLIVLLFIALTFPQWGSSQDDLNNELSYEVNKIYPYISITKEKLKEAKSIADFKNKPNDLNLDYNPSWVREYISVEILTSYKGEIMKAVSKSEILSQEQKKMMNMADAGTDILVKIKYIPENTLSENDPKNLDFTFTVDPESEAKYTGGEEQLKKYLKEKAIDKIPNTSFKNYDLAAVKFTISEEGEIINAHVFETSKDEKIDDLLLETVRNMPCWKPAEYAKDIKVKQEFVLTVGNMENCVVNLLNIERD